jgi:hypothetical protein
MIDLDYSDLFLLAAATVDEAIDGGHRPVLVPKLRSILQWFSDITTEHEDIRQSEIGAEIGGQLGGKVPFSLTNLFVKLTASFKGTSRQTYKVRETLRRHPDDLINLTKDLLEAANRVAMDEMGCSRGILLILDNMDRYDPVQIDAILMRSSQQIRKLACHTVFTFPISLAYKPITGRLDYPLTLLPMLSIRNRDAPWAETAWKSEYEEGRIATVRDMLAARIDLDRFFINRSDVDRLIRLSGGSVRDLIQLVALSVVAMDEGDRINSEAVGLALQELRGTYMRLLATTPYDYRCLAAVAKRASTATADMDFSDALGRLLFNGCLLEYADAGAPWYDIHPLLLETEELRHALQTA